MAALLPQGAVGIEVLLFDERLRSVFLACRRAGKSGRAAPLPTCLPVNLVDSVVAAASWRPRVLTYEVTMMEYVILALAIATATSDGNRRSRVYVEINTNLGYSPEHELIS